MAMSVKKVVLWRTEVASQPGELARVLGPLADAGANLRVVMGYRQPDEHTRSVIELFPLTGRKQVNAAESVGLRASGIPCLLVDGDDRPGLGRDMADAVADAGINIAFLMAQTAGRKFSAVFGFANNDDATAAMKRIKAAARARPKRRR